MNTELNVLVDVTSVAVGFLAVAVVTRRWLIRELRTTRAAVFRLMMSERRQSGGIIALWECMNRQEPEKRCNGATEEKIKKVKLEDEALAKWVRAVSMGLEPPVEEQDD